MEAGEGNKCIACLYYVLEELCFQVLAQLLWMSPGAGVTARAEFVPAKVSSSRTGVMCPGGMGATLRPQGLGFLPGPSPSDTLGFLQTKALIDKLQKLVSSEGRFKNLREALKK